MRNTRTWRQQGMCGVHNGPGYNLNLIYPSGLVAQFFGLKKDTWVCEACHKHAKENNFRPLEPRQSSDKTEDV